MTNNERAAVQKFINKVSELDRISDETLATLKDMNEAHGDGHRWCSWKANLDGLAANLDRDDIIYGRAEYQYERHIKAEAQKDLIRSLGQDLAELGFWK